MPNSKKPPVRADRAPSPKYERLALGMTSGVSHGKGPAGDRQGAGRRGQASGEHQFQRQFGDLEVAVITAPGDAGEQLVREVQRTRARARHIWPAPELIPTTFDVVYCDLLDDLPQRLPWLPGEPAATLILVVDPFKPVDLDLVHKCAAHAAVYQPATAAAVLTSMLVGRSHFLYERRLRGRISKLDDNLRTMRSVEQAKAILMRSRSLSEEEAYHYLRCQAMERRVTIGILANAIVDSQDLLGNTR